MQLIKSLKVCSKCCWTHCHSPTAFASSASPATSTSASTTQSSCRSARLPTETSPWPTSCGRTNASRPELTSKTPWTSTFRYLEVTFDFGFETFLLGLNTYFVGFNKAFTKQYQAHARLRLHKNPRANC